MQWSGKEEELRQLKEQEKIIKEAQEKFKTIDSESNPGIPPTPPFSLSFVLRSTGY